MSDILSAPLSDSKPAAPRPASNPKSKSKRLNILWRNGWAYYRKVVTDPVTGVKKRTTIALGTQDQVLAVAKIRKIRNEVKFGELDSLKGPRKSQLATIGQVLARYKARIGSVNESIDHGSVLRNTSALRCVVAWSLGEEGKRNVVVDVEALSAGVLDDLLVARFKSNYVRAAGADLKAKEGRRRGAEGQLRQAKSVFSKQAMLIYRDFNLPDLSRFRAAARMETEDRVHLPISAAILKEIDLAAAKLREVNPRLWLVHVLQKFLGLRNEEICQARVEWFRRAPWGQVFFSVMRTAYFEPKRSEGHVPVRAEVAALVAPLVAGKQGADFLIEAKHPTERNHVVNDEHAAFMRQFLPRGDFAKAGYELRRWAAQVMEERYGHEAAKAFLRHVPQGVAERHYFERWFPWRRLGVDIGVSLNDARGLREDAAAGTWQEGVAAFAAPAAPPAPNARSETLVEKTPDNAKEPNGC